MGNNSQPEIELDVENIIKEYQALNEKCDKVIKKIKKRRRIKNGKQQAA